MNEFWLIVSIAGSFFLACWIAMDVQRRQQRDRFRWKMENTIEGGELEEVKTLARRMRNHGVECTPTELWQWVMCQTGFEQTAFGYVHDCLASDNQFMLMLSYFRREREMWDVC